MLRVEFDGPVARATLDRPEVKNAFNDELIGLMADLFAKLPPSIRVVVIGGEGSAFCAGGDLQWMKKAASYTEQQNFEDALKLAKLFQAIVDSHAVVIAKVHGPAFGGGCGVVAAADVALASTRASFAFSEVKLGLVPATISPFVIPKIGESHARALFTTGEVFDAQRALRIGLVHDVAEESDLDDAVQKKVKSVLAAGPGAVSISKRLAQQSRLDLEDAARLLAKARSLPEGKEGVAAFLEKRRAAFNQVT